MLIFFGEKLVGANFYAFCNYAPITIQGSIYLCSTGPEIFIESESAWQEFYQN